MYRGSSYKKGSRLLLAKTIRQQQRFLYIPGKGSWFDKLRRVGIPSNWWARTIAFMEIDRNK